jgi:hypothetical protein
MDYELISEEEYEALPYDEPERCFVEFERTVRGNMTRLIDQNSSNDFDQAVRQQYMAMVEKVAAECGIPNIHYDAESEENFWPQFNRFSLAVQGEVARVRIRVLGRHKPYSVLLTANTRTTIEHYIGRIRDAAEKSDLDTGLKKRIGQRLDQLAAELKAPRLGFAKSMAILVGVVSVMGNSVTIAAEGHNAVAQIMRLIGQDKETEDAAAKRLAPPPKALPAPPAKSAAPEKTSPVMKTAVAGRGGGPNWDAPRASELDDEIPF